MLQTSLDNPARATLPAAIAARYREIWRRRGAMRWIGFLVETWMRLFITLQFAIWAAFECDNWRTAEWLCGVGFALDIIRNFTLEHLRLNVMGLRARIDALLQTENQHKLEIWTILNRAFFFLLFLFVMQFTMWGPKTEHAPVPHMIHAMMPLEQVTYHMSTTMRHIMISLVEHGYPNRAGESGFFFMIGTWVTLMFTCAMGFGYGQIIAFIWASARIESGMSVNFRDCKKAFLGFVLLFSTFYFIMNFEHVDWIDEAHILGVHLFKNNYSFLMYSLVYGCFFMMIWFFYTIVAVFNIQILIEPKILNYRKTTSEGSFL